MYTMTASEFWGIVVIAVILGAAVWDVIWSGIVPDARAATHFGRVTTKKKLAWIGVAILVVVAATGWIY